MIFKNNSLEGFIIVWLSVFAGLLVAVIGALLWQSAVELWLIIVTVLLMIWGSIAAIVRFYRRVIESFQRALLHLEAIRQDDYKQYAKPVFTAGSVGKFHQYLCAFSGDLSIKKQRYDQHAYLVYQLIDQLSIPVMVFNDKGQLSYANGAFSKLYAGKPWQSYRYASAQLLGLTDTQEGFQFNRDDFAEHAQWQISQSCFIDADRTYRLVVFTNIKAAVHSGKIQAWQQMINVMGHEIRNSLTPVSSIAQSLAGRAADQRDQDALALISQRCLLLQDFVDRYACLSKRLHIQSENIQSREVVARIKHLFAQASITAKYKADELQADKSLLEQVLINLVKNALEANAKNIHLEFNEDHVTSFIHVIDDGHGFANIDNAFVPLFTTKEEGQGIGLSFCRNIIEHHKGTLNVRNNEGSGVTMTIQLPKI